MFNNLKIYVKFYELYYALNNKFQYLKRKLNIVRDCNLLINKPVKIKYNDIQFEYIGNEEEKVNKFIKKIKDRIDDSNLDILGHNLNSFKVNYCTDKDDAYLGLNTGGMYLPKHNEIYLKNRKYYKKRDKFTINGSSYDQTINHELLHVASTIANDRYVSSGFYYSNSDYGYGLLLNEGYTDYMNYKLFNSVNTEKSYLFAMNCCEIIDKVLGEDVVEDLYFKRDLYTLRELLSKYTSLEETNGFIIDLDLIDTNRESIKRVITYLDKLYTNKLNYDLKNGNISSIDYTNEIKYLENQKVFLYYAITFENDACIEICKEKYKYKTFTM